MAKKDDFENKKARVKELLTLQEETEKELRSLLEPVPLAVPPVGFSIGAEVMKLIRQAGGAGVNSQIILQTLQNTYPSYGIDRERVASALAYEKNTKHSVELVARGVYRVKTATPNSTEQGAV